MTDVQKPFFEPIETSFSAETAVEEAADAFAKETTGHAGLAQLETDRLRLVIEELVTNIRTHGHPAPGSEITLKAEHNADGLLLTVKDWGIPFDPRIDAPTDDRDADLEDRGIGGLGWPLILELAKIVDYRRSEDGQNILVLALRGTG